MKKLYFFVLTLLALTVSCSKETVVENDPEEAIHTISATILDDETKATYTNESVFAWQSGDKISYIVKNTLGSSPTNKYDRYQYTTQGSGSKVSFTGTAPSSPWSAVDYAYYPYDGTSGYTSNTFDIAKTTTLQAILYGTIKAYPDRLKGIIPMVGKKVGSDDAGKVENYHFYPVTGVLKLSFTGLPATASQIRLTVPDAATYPLNGTFNVIERTVPEIKAEDVSTGYPEKYLNFEYSSSSDAFYIPLPTGTIPAGKLTVSVMGGDTILYSITNKVDITLTRGEITQLPTITVPSFKVKMSGTLDAPKATFYYSGDVSTVRYYVDSQYSQVYETDAEASSGVTISLPASNSGKFFLNYVGYDSNGTAIYGTKEYPKYVNYYVLTSSDATTYLGTYTTTKTSIDHFDGDANATANLVLVASDDLTKSNVMITTIVNQTYDNKPVYGILAGTSASFFKSSDDDYFKFKNNNYWFVGQSTSNPGDGNQVTIEDLSFTIASSTETTLTMGGDKYLHYYYHKGSKTGNDLQWTHSNTPGLVFTKQ